LNGEIDGFIEGIEVDWYEGTELGKKEG